MLYLALPSVSWRAFLKCFPSETEAEKAATNQICKEAEKERKKAKGLKSGAVSQAGKSKKRSKKMQEAEHSPAAQSKQRKMPLKSVHGSRVLLALAQP